jgi:hypothetical protein
MIIMTGYYDWLLHFFHESNESRILVPIITAVEGVDGLMKDDCTAAYIQAAFGSAKLAKKAILVDFFRHGFDGSGADNFFDAGSCIDGR